MNFDNFDELETYYFMNSYYNIPFSRNRVFLNSSMKTQIPSYNPNKMKQSSIIEEIIDEDVFKKIDNKQINKILEEEKKNYLNSIYNNNSILGDVIIRKHKHKYYRNGFKRHFTTETVEDTEETKETKETLINKNRNE